MMNDLIVIFRWTIIVSCSLYGYFKLAKIKIGWINLIDLIFALILTTGLYFATKQIKILRPIGLLLLISLYNFARYRNPMLNTVIISTISCGISIISYTITTIASLPLDFLMFLCKPTELVANLVTVSIICILQLILIFLIYRIKRFKSGISVQNNDGNLELLLLVSILSIFLMTLVLTDNVKDSSFSIILICFIFCGLGFIIWWKKHITGNYRKQLYKRNEEQYETRIKEYEKERAELLDSNAELSKIIHRDNKLIPAMVIAVKELVKNGKSSEDANKILSQLEVLSLEHNEIIERYQAKSDILPKSDNAALDGVLRFIASKATQSCVELNVEIDKESIPLLLSKITDMTDLSTILCDLGENAIIAARDISNGKVFIKFELADMDKPCFYVYDNGALFDEKVIANMGKKKITTHLSDGGSGIGLMALFEILDKYKASFCLNESTENGQFTKYIKVTFDDFHKISIITERKNVRKICSLRADLVIV